MKSFLLIVVACVAATQAAIDWDNLRHMDNYIYPGELKPIQDLGLEGRVVGGHEAKIGQFPHQVGVFLQLSNGQAFCGGSLISKKYVLTAAHCAEGVSNFTLVLGAHNIRGNDPTRVELEAGKALVHPKYDNKNIVNDIAIITLPKEVQLNNNIQLIRLPSKSDKSSHAEEPSIISGWGKPTDSASGISPVLKYAENRILTNEYCGELLFGREVPKTQVCQSGKNGNSACNGDSGGPLTITEKDNVKTQVGITSYGTILGCSIGLPTSYTRVSEYLDFIAENTDVKLRP
ncbi:chymotrypsin BI-like [Chrysoperla carnea]|uniref:chymotrypsin BI-like n=1 Tax=Chrysoperla carnea TaxID=189513 RepID=UPI001D05DFD8|nr:chymotrypsin BI-like [Chrysoperla carnea]